MARCKVTNTVCCRCSPTDRAGSRHGDYIKKVRAPYESKLNEKLAVTEEMLYRRGNFNGTFDQVIVDALMEVKVPIWRSPGFPLGHQLAAGRRHYHGAGAGPDLHHLSCDYTERDERPADQGCAGGRGDNLFNPDPYYQQGATWCAWAACNTPATRMKRRQAHFQYGAARQASGSEQEIPGGRLASVQENVTGTPIWDVVANICGT